MRATLLGTGCYSRHSTTPGHRLCRLCPLSASPNPLHPHTHKNITGRKALLNPRNTHSLLPSGAWGPGTAFLRDKRRGGQRRQQSVHCPVLPHRARGCPTTSNSKVPESPDSGGEPPTPTERWGAIRLLRNRHCLLTSSKHNLNSLESVLR